MTQEEIKKILPHRDKMLLVDEAEICTDSLDEQGNPTKCTGSYTITGEEWFLQGHFPGNPVVPGVVLCDDFGAVVCLGERECSIQRKNQKLIEECPSSRMDEQTRQRMMKAAETAARAVGYRNAGTVEFLLDRDGNFYFMEMNTRLQVEHTVTEMVTGFDLVKWQIRIAAGQPLGFEQKDVHLDGHAIECRINAEDPEHDFRPSCGRVTLLHVPGGPWVRFDTALYQDYFVPPYYDSMVGKLVVYAKTREEAIRKLQAALCELVIEGISHNSGLHMELLEVPAFREGDYYTDFMNLRKGGRSDAVPKAVSETKE